MKILFFNKILLITCAFILSINLSAQHDEIKNRDVITQFDNNKELWIKKYSGTFDHVHPITMAIATNGEEWRGIYRFESSKTQFVIEADNNNNLLDFVELNNNNQVTGHLLMKLDQDKMIGEWKSDNGLQTYDVVLYEQTNKVHQKTDDKKRSSFVDIYSGTFLKDRAEFTVVKESDEMAMMQLTINNNILNIDPTCANEDCSIFEDNLEDRLEGFTNIRFKKLKNSYGITAITNDGRKEFATLTKDGSLDYKNYNYADYHQKKDILYPRTGTKFDQYFDNQITAYTKQNKNHLNDDLSTSDRFDNVLLAWVDIHYYDANIISGLLFYTLDGGSQMTRSFTYHLQENKELDIKNMLKGKHTLEQKAANFISMTKENTAKFDNAAVQEWYKNQPFDLITLNQEGICFSTEYNTIVGTQSITLPYSQLEDKLKKEYRKAFLKK